MPDGYSIKDEILEKARRYGLRVSSSYRTPDQNRAAGGAKNSFHLQKGAAYDFAGSPDAMRAFAQDVAQSDAGNLAELYYDPVGGWKHGKSIGAIGNHSDHVHVAFGNRSERPSPRPSQIPRS